MLLDKISHPYYQLEAVGNKYLNDKILDQLTLLFWALNQIHLQYIKVLLCHFNDESVSGAIGVGSFNTTVVRKKNNVI
jgi:hypothetical protein